MVSFLSLVATPLSLVVGPIGGRATQPSVQSRAAALQMAFPRVVVTGMGIVSPLGASLEDVNEQLHSCTPGITYCQEFEDVGMKSRVSGMPTFDCPEPKTLNPKP